MKFSLVFENSGDSIPFQTVSSGMDEILKYYVKNLNERNLNKFSSPIGHTVKTAIDTLHETIIECNKFVYELLDKNIDTYDTEDYLNQRNLNKLHADWASSQTVRYNILEKRKQYGSKQAEQIHNIFSDDIPTPVIGSVISRLGYTDIYDQINQAVHTLENMFENVLFSVAPYDFVDEHMIEFPNPFPTSYITNDICNFKFSFAHLGRALENKFKSFDYDLEFNDENTFNEFLGCVEINLMAPETIPLSDEYRLWCKKVNKPPSGKYFNIGNIPDLTENLTKYRQIIFRNSLQNNGFSIQLNKGT
jgi:hypothetical protein